MIDVLCLELLEASIVNILHERVEIEVASFRSDSSNKLGQNTQSLSRNSVVVVAGCLVDLPKSIIIAKK